MERGRVEFAARLLSDFTPSWAGRRAPWPPRSAPSVISAISGISGSGDHRADRIDHRVGLVELDVVAAAAGHYLTALSGQAQQRCLAGTPWRIQIPAAGHHHQRLAPQTRRLADLPQALRPHARLVVGRSTGRRAHRPSGCYLPNRRRKLAGVAVKAERLFQAPQAQPNLDLTPQQLD